MLAVSIPNADTFSAFVDTATKWSATASSPSASTSQARAVRALVRVSIVPKVLEATMNSVDAGSAPASTPAMSAPSMLDTNDERIRGWANAFSARVAIAGPRSEPPMPMLTTWVIDSSLRIRSANAAIWSSTACTSGTTSAPSTFIDTPAGARSATCITARSSVVLMCSPANMASRRASTPASRASSNNRWRIGSSTDCFE